MHSQCWRRLPARRSKKLLSVNAELFDSLPSRKETALTALGLGAL
jgi:hypothetical protein